MLAVQSTIFGWCHSFSRSRPGTPSRRNGIRCFTLLCSGAITLRVAFGSLF